MQLSWITTPDPESLIKTNRRCGRWRSAAPPVFQGGRARNCDGRGIGWSGGDCL